MNLSKHYDVLYDRADKLLKDFNPCNIIDGTCNAMRQNKERNEPCCRARGQMPQCINLGESGCEVQSLHCKTWLCTEIRHNSYLESRLREIKREARSAGINIELGFRKGKEAHLPTGDSK